MPGQYTAQVTRTSTEAAREIKAGTHYTYITNGLTLDGIKADYSGGILLEGTCLVRDVSTGKFELYQGDFTGKDFPVILDTSVRFTPEPNGVYYDVVVGAAITHGSVYRAMCIGIDDAFEEAMKGSVIFY